MKKIVLTISAICAFTASTFAQTKTEQVFDKYRFSIFLGPTFNSLKPTSSTADNYVVTKDGSKTGFSFGLTGEWNLNDRYTAYSGIGLDTRGGGIDVLHDTTAIDANYLRSANVKYKMQYLTIPLGLKLKAAQFDKIKIYAQTGLDLGILISQKGNYTGVLNDGTAAKSLSNAKLKGQADMFPINVGWCIGVGGEYAISKDHAAYLSLIYRNGIIDATTPKINNDGYKFSDGNIRSNTIAVRVGYYF